MQTMRTLCEVRWIKEGTENDDTPVYESGRYWLMHFGLKHEIVNHADGSVTAVSYTVAICQNYENGNVECFLPEQLRIIGEERKT
jgi:hypothetical protein